MACFYACVLYLPKSAFTNSVNLPRSIKSRCMASEYTLRNYLRGYCLPHMHSMFLAVKVHDSGQLLLSACLSCEGCVSEEESLKISQQNLEEVKRVLALNKVQRHATQPPSSATATLNSVLSSPALFCATSQKCDVSKHKVLVASVCPQSLPFFAVKFGVDITDAAHKLCGFLKSIGEQVGFTSFWIFFSGLCPRN